MSRSVETPPSHARFSWIPIAPIWLTFLGWSLLRVPVPGVNEPHYLGKARHWWNPEWCPGDFFLDSSNPHLVFYCTFGWFAHFFSLPVAAVIGRTLGLLVLACGWQRLSHAVTGFKWAGLLAAPLFLMLQSLGNLSGEWLVGGIEAKVPAYGCLFWAIGSFLSGRFLSAAVVAGMAVSLHPLVGLWGVVAAGMATALMRFTSASPSLPRLRTGMMMLLLFGVASLPGLVPALGTLRSSDPSLDRIANQLQVAGRLAHHLDPMRFHKEAYRYFGMMLVMWLLVQRRVYQTPRQRWWTAFVLSAVFIVGIGIILGWGARPVTKMPGFEWRLKLLKFYFFRLGDQLVPIALALSATCLYLESMADAVRKRRLLAAGGLAAVITIIGALTIPFPDGNPSRLSPQQLQHWSEACAWMESHSQPEDLIHCTDSGWAIKWYAQRPEYVSYKDMPQDSASICEWNRRLWVIANWRIASMNDNEVTAAELADLEKLTGIRFLVCRKFGPVSVTPVYSNDTFQVYEIPQP
ncbi:DUF6798 domain-containing protein [Planctomicrobium sp. SH661]|uniref:DUF6798 domain-containing protein n=1 Tax=Planctomicrobium sp. SH661 TaxID=3448124 RepID=UPI003F5B496D